MKTKRNLNKFYHYAFPMQAALVTCNDNKKDKTNIITVAWHTTISRSPPVYGISIAPHRYSHDCINDAKEFVVNFAPHTLMEQVNYCGTHSGRTTDKVKDTYLSLISAKKIDTPLIKECFAHLECKLHDTITLGDHTLMLGKVVAVSADNNAFKNDILDPTKVKPTHYLGDNIYTTIDKNTVEKY